MRPTDCFDVYNSGKRINSTRAFSMRVFVCVHDARKTTDTNPTASAAAAAAYERALCVSVAAAKYHLVSGHQSKMRKTVNITAAALVL